MMSHGLPGGVRVNHGRMILAVILCSVSWVVCAERTWAQTIQPVIMEYGEKADSRFEVTNDTLTPMAVVLEPKSFTINQDGHGTFRALDRGIHVSLSASSFRLEPKQSYLVFYKASADALPAWFTVYATFSPIRRGDGMNVRIMLPHTVYLYQKKMIDKESIRVGAAMYAPDTGKLSCDVENTGRGLVRVQEVRAIGGKTSEVSAGFPLLPGNSRHISVDWKEKGKPEYLLFHFPHFDIKTSLTDVASNAPTEQHDH
jgi:hypothetical protein